MSSAVKRIDLAIGKLADLSSKNALKGQLYSLGLEEPDILYLSKYGTVVPKALQDKVKAIQDAILAKTITFESCTDGGKETRCVKGA